MTYEHLHESQSAIYTVEVLFVKNKVLFGGLAEYRCSYRGRKEIESKAPMKGKHNTECVLFQDIKLTSDDFEILGADFVRNRPEQYTRGNTGLASCLLVRQDNLLNYAESWLVRHR